MNWKRMTSLAAAGLLLLAVQATAQPSSDVTRLTFSEAVKVPGATLQPGEYIFEVGDPEALPHVVQVWTPDRQRMVAQFQAVPMRRNTVERDGVIAMFSAVEGSERADVALKGWFYPGERHGHEFLYPEAEARQIAERTRERVLSAGDDGRAFAIDRTGARGEYEHDPVFVREWTTWIIERNDNTMSQDEARGATGETETRGTMGRTETRGTTGETETRGTTGTAASGATTPLEREIQALERLIDRSLADASGQQVNVQRSTLEQMRAHVRQIERLHRERGQQEQR